jgi:hypothetical protein
MRCLSVVPFALALVAWPLAAQNAVDLVGQRVRLHTVYGSSVVGRLSRLGPDSAVVTLVRKDEPVEQAVPRDHLARVERSVGRSPDFARGLIMGATCIAVSYGVSFLYSAVLVPDGWESTGPNSAFIIGTGIGAGLVVAFARPKDRWERVPELPTVMPVVGAAEGGASIGLRMRF